MKRMIAITIRPGATTAAARLIVLGKARPIMPPPAATRTRKNVPSNSEKRRRHNILTLAASAHRRHRCWLLASVGFTKIDCRSETSEGSEQRPGELTPATIMGADMPERQANAARSGKEGRLVRIFVIAQRPS